MRYLWWPEFQRRGALHYHAVIVDPPFEFLRDARHWFDTHWRGADGRPLADIQTWVDWRSGDWFRKKGGDYVLKDVRKLHGKHYEQDYTRMPKGWRTFRSHWRTFTAAEHLEHETKAWTVCVAKPEAAWHERQRAIWIYRIDRHVPASCGCKLTRPRRNRSVAGHTALLRQRPPASPRLVRGFPLSVPNTVKYSPLEGQVSPGLRSPWDTTGDPGLSWPTTGGTPAARGSNLDGTAVVLTHQSGAQHGRDPTVVRPRGLF